MGRKRNYQIHSNILGLLYIGAKTPLAEGQELLSFQPKVARLNAACQVLSHRTDDDLRISPRSNHLCVNIGS